MSERYWTIVKFDLRTRTHLAAFNQWYDTTHVPEVLGHMDGCTHCWRTAESRDEFSIGPEEQEFWAIYEVDSPTAFGQAPATPTMVTIDAPDKPFRRDVTHWGRTCHRVQAAYDGEGRGRWWVKLAFDLDGPAEEREAFNAHCREVYFPRLLSHPAVHRAWQLETLHNISHLGPEPLGEFTHIIEIDSPSVVMDAPFPKLAAWEDSVVASSLVFRALHFAEVLLEYPDTTD